MQKTDKAYVRKPRICRKCGKACEKFVCAECVRARRTIQRRSYPRTRRSYVYKCVGCGVDFHPKAKDRTYCTRECAFLHSEQRYNTDAWRSSSFKRTKPPPPPPPPRPPKRILEKNHWSMVRWDKQLKGKINTCQNCSVQWSPLFGVPHNKRSCSEICSLESIKKSKRSSKALRRARERGAHSLVVDPFTIFERDQWCCQGCGCRTPMELRGTNHDNAPELDHRTALSRGGIHAPHNLQTLCRVCNILKSDMPWHEYLQMYGGGGV